MEDKKLTDVVPTREQETGYVFTDEDKEKFDELERMVNENIETWLPEEGDTLLGVLQDRREKTGKFGSTLYVIKRTDGALIGVWGSTVIKGKLDAAKIGAKVAIKYIGVSKGEMGNYKNYRIIIDQEPEN